MKTEFSCKELWENFCYSELDKQGYIPFDWIIHLNGDIEHLDGDNYQKDIVIPFEDWSINFKRL